MKILVIFTGGTIGSSAKDGWISTDSSTNFTLINNYKTSRENDTVFFEVASPYTVLSENLTASELNILGKTILEYIDMDFDGIIVTHGTDTLQYSSAALAYELNGCNIPIVLVSSDYPLDDKRSNGNINFMAAVDFIKNKGGKGVFVAYKNNNENIVNIHIATRLLQHQESSANIYSIDNKPYAFWDGSIKINFEYIPSEQSIGIGLINFCNEPQIIVIESRPCDNFIYSLDGCRAVILKPYHSGTLNTSSKKLKNFCKTAKERNVPIFLVNTHTGDSYETSRIFDELGLTILPLCTYISTYVKIWAAISMNKKIETFVKTPLAQEFCVG